MGGALKDGTAQGTRASMDQYLRFPVETPEDFQKLKKRGLRRVGLCISDAHAGIAYSDESGHRFWSKQATYRSVATLDFHYMPLWPD